MTGLFKYKISTFAEDYSICTFCLGSKCPFPVFLVSKCSTLWLLGWNQSVVSVLQLSAMFLSLNSSWESFERCEVPGSEPCGITFLIPTKERDLVTVVAGTGQFFVYIWATKNKIICVTSCHNGQWGE